MQQANSVVVVVALADFTPATQNEMEMREGQLFVLMAPAVEGWVKVCRINDSLLDDSELRGGFVPVTYISTAQPDGLVPVSYTHLTLPTILLV